MMRYTFFLLFFPFFYSYAAPVKEKGMSALIEVEIIDNNAVDIEGELQLSLSDYFSFRYPIWVNTKTKVRKVRDQDTLCFRVPLSGHINFMEVKYMTPGKDGPTRYSGYFLKKQAFMIRDGDSIRVRIMADSLHFSGKGSDRLNLQLDISGIGSDWKYDRGNISEDTAVHIRRFIDSREKVAEKQIELLDRYKNNIEPEIYNLVYFDIIGLRNLTIVTGINSMIVGGSNKEKEKKNNFNRLAYSILMEEPSNLDVPFSEDWHLSPYFMDYLLLKELFLIKQTTSNTDDSNEIAITENKLYKLLSEKFTGKIRDRLLVMGAAYLIRNDFQSENYLRTIGKDIKTQSYRELALGLYASHGVGKPVYEFSLPDSSGNLVNLTDFLGKAVVVDFWFTGCIPCQNLKKMMEPIVSYYEKDKVVFITISVDKSMEVWKEKGIKSGQYTHKGGIDLFTNGQGWNAPIVKYYNLTSVPSLLIIDKKGKLVSASPPRPNSNDDIDKLKALIDQAIGK